MCSCRDGNCSVYNRDLGKNGQGLKNPQASLNNISCSHLLQILLELLLLMCSGILMILI